MITKELIVEFLNQIKEIEFFVVEVKLTPNMKISVFIDSLEGIKIGDISTIHKALYSRIETKEENFDLEISSPGLTSLLKVWQQYLKLKGKNIQIVSEEDEVIDCIVVDADETKVEVKLKNEEILTFAYQQIRKAKQIINI